MKDIVIIAHFAASLQPGDNNRFFDLAGRLSAHGRVELVTSDFYHSGKCRRTGDYSQFPFRVTLLHEPGYPKNVCLRRFCSHWVFGRAVARCLKGRKKPDVIYCAMPSLGAAGAAADYARRNGVRFIVDVQDLWPEAFRMVFDLPPVSDLLFAPMTRKADRIYAQADEVIAVSDTYRRRAIQANHRCGGHTVYLGTELSVFDGHVRDHLSPPKESGELWVAYCGTLGSNYDLLCAMDALETLEKKGHGNVTLHIMGDGPLREKFLAYAEKKPIRVRFWGRLPYGEMCALLSACDIALNPIRAGSACSITNKHADYAAAGIPVVNSQESEEYRALVEGYGMGLNCACGDPADMAKQLAFLLKHPEERERMGKNARRCAEERFDRGTTYQTILDLVLRKEGPHEGSRHQP